ncbi:hypothetical protein EQG49_03680 [Periweissella cryptocerci]|uniref:Surface layer protein A domain-containing protein n=1 Tax=Periweissella cryptocerci TaxID=2506420 RepID=A0A4P6YSI0_9LACO|nr:hypothetical protein [Periweissella cryptocerci]QBO35621.1 hypothetical protein EQG49_03680 [Periweissella cryptocerci]
MNKKLPLILSLVAAFGLLCVPITSHAAVNLSENSHKAVAAKVIKTTKIPATNVFPKSYKNATLIKSGTHFYQASSYIKSVYYAAGTFVVNKRVMIKYHGKSHAFYQVRNLLLENDPEGTDHETFVPVSAVKRGINPQQTAVVLHAKAINPHLETVKKLTPTYQIQGSNVFKNAAMVKIDTLPKGFTYSRTGYQVFLAEHDGNVQLYNEIKSGVNFYYIKVGQYNLAD